MHKESLHFNTMTVEFVLYSNAVNVSFQAFAVLQVQSTAESSLQVYCIYTEK